MKHCLRINKEYRYIYFDSRILIVKRQSIIQCFAHFSTGFTQSSSPKSHIGHEDIIMLNFIVGLIYCIVI